MTQQKQKNGSEQEHIFELNELMKNLPKNKNQLNHFRPTLVIGAGGSGQYATTCLKAQFIASYGDEWRTRIQLLAFDTTIETFQVQSGNELISLEQGAEFFEIGHVPVSSIRRNIDSQQAINERLGPVLSKLPAGVMRNGSKQLRALGLLALLWNYRDVKKQIWEALWRLANRNQVDVVQMVQQGINIFIVSSLVGGTGSGTTLDMAYMVRDAFTDLGSQAEFCHITGVGVLPQAFHGIKGPNMLPNAGAYLQELNHLMVKGNFEMRYPDGRYFKTVEPPFDIYFVVDGIDQLGRTWPNIYAVSAMAAQCIYLQMGSQIGKKGENAFDNLTDILSQVTPEGQGTFLGSFGKGDLIFDAPAVARLCTHWLLLAMAEDEWLQPVVADLVKQESYPLLAKLGEEQIRPFLLQDPDTEGDLQHDLYEPAWVRQKPVGEIAGEAARYVSEYGQARVAEKMLPQIKQNGKTFANRVSSEWTEWLRSILFTRGISLPTVTAACQQLQDVLEIQLQSTQKAISEQERKLDRLEQEMVQAETAVSKATASFFVGRNGRIRDSVAHYFRTAATYFEAQFIAQIMRTQRNVWQALHQWARTHTQAVTLLQERVATMSAAIEKETARQLEKLGQGGVATLSLADEAFVRHLYDQHRPVWADIKSQIPNPLVLCEHAPDTLIETFVNVFSSHFAPIAQTTIEDVIVAKTSDMSPRARLQQIKQLATPSWNIDRTRLPDGGTNLVWLEVLGVPDATHTIFEGEPMLVSTYDPYRITASVVVVGAPANALQQYDQYVRAMEQVGGKRPLYVLPDFLVTADQGRLLFALGSIFGLIYSQGTFFYYQPADPLETAVKLANGLSNAIQAFSDQEELVNEVSERVEAQVARLGLREAIGLLTEYYATAPNGNTALDEQVRELKRLVRDYVDSLRRIDAFSVGMHDASVRSS